MHEMRGGVRADVRTELLVAAVQILATDGPSGLTVPRVAERASTTADGAHEHFRGKSDLINALAVEGFDELDRATESAWRSSDEGLTGYVDSCLAYWDWAIEHPIVYQLMFTRHMADAGIAPDTQRRGRAFIDRYVARVALLAGAGYVGVESGGVPEVADYLWGLVHGRVMAAILRETERNDEVARAQFARSVRWAIRGVAPRR